MHKAEIVLEDWQYERLRSLSEQTEKSLSDLVLEAVDEFLEPESSSLRSIDGIFEDPGVSGRDHDHFLYDEPRRS